MERFLNDRRHLASKSPKGAFCRRLFKLYLFEYLGHNGIVPGTVPRRDIKVLKCRDSAKQWLVHLYRTTSVRRCGVMVTFLGGVLASAILEASTCYDTSTLIFRSHSWILVSHFFSTGVFPNHFSAKKKTDFPGTPHLTHYIYPIWWKLCCCFFYVILRIILYRAISCYLR